MGWGTRALQWDINQAPTMSPMRLEGICNIYHGLCPKEELEPILLSVKTTRERRRLPHN